MNLPLIMVRIFPGKHRNMKKKKGGVGGIAKGRNENRMYSER